MKFTVWYSTESMADYIIDHTDLCHHECAKRTLLESDASKPKDFHSVPDHLKKILYLDAPDIIVELDSDPVFTIEESKEAGTGHNAFQRFSRLAASAENGIPAFYIYPEAVAIKRRNAPAKWDVINPLIGYAMESLCSIFNTPSLMFFYPSQYGERRLLEELPEDKGLKLYKGDVRYLSCPDVDGEMRALFSCVNVLVRTLADRGKSGIQELLKKTVFRNRREKQLAYFYKHSEGIPKETMSPLSATNEVDTSLVVDYLCRTGRVSSVGALLSSRPKTVLYSANASFRGDPYPGALSAIDYMLCRNGPTFEDRDRNLVMVWGHPEVTDGHLTIEGDASIDDFCAHVRNTEQHNLLSLCYADVRARHQIPRYYMQTRYGSTYSKSKEIRIYSYFCDAILFKDGALWREG